MSSFIRDSLWPRIDLIICRTDREKVLSWAYWYRRNRRRKKPPCLLTVTSIFNYFNCFLEPLKRAGTNMNQVIAFYLLQGCTARFYRLTFFISAASPFEMIDCLMDLSCVVLSNCLLGLKVFFNCS